MLMYNRKSRESYIQGYQMDEQRTKKDAIAFGICCIAIIVVVALLYVCFDSIHCDCVCVHIRMYL